nr:ATP-binding cassette sub-family B member 10, mitochondrial-like isoform X2 [Salvelinus alpinus]
MFTHPLYSLVALLVQKVKGKLKRLELNCLTFPGLSFPLCQQFYVSPSLAAFVLLIVPPMAGLAVIYGRYLHSISKRTQDSLAEATQLAEERISNMRTVCAFVPWMQRMSSWSRRLWSGSWMGARC